MIKIDNYVNAQLYLNKGFDQTNNQKEIKNNLLTYIGRFTKKINISRLKNTNGKISLIKVAQLGINGINQMANSHIKLIEKTDTSGKVTALSFESGIFKYYRSKTN